MKKFIVALSVAFGMVLAGPGGASAVEPSTATSGVVLVNPMAYGAKEYRAYKRYFKKYLPKSSTEKPMKRKEASKVARNFCDNSVDDFEIYFTAYTVVAAETEALAQAAALVDAYCPSARLSAMRGADNADYLADWPGKKATSGGNAAGKAAYIATVNSLAPDTLFVDDATLLEVGIVSCQLLDEGGNFTSIVRAAVDSDLDSEVAAAIVFGAVEHLCPGHRTFLDQWLAS